MTETRALVATAVDPDVSAALQIYERIKPLKDALGVKNLTDDELQVFAIVSRHTGLDPFTKQIYAIKRGGRVTHQTGIDGYRSVAERTGQYAGSDEPTFEECACGDKDSPNPHPKAARVVVHRILPTGYVVDQTGVAWWHELKPDHKTPQGAYDALDAMWWRMPHNQLAKCAEAAGLRKAFPRVLGGVYVSEEMQGAETVDGTAVEVSSRRPSLAERVSAKRAELETHAESREATAEPSVVTDAATGREDESSADATKTEPSPADTAASPSPGSTELPSAQGLSKTAFIARLAAAGIEPNHAGIVRLVMFPDASAELTDEDRGQLLAQLLAEKDAAA